jgi:hypothetical protein
MPAHAYTEDQLVEQPAIGLFAELGWTTVSALEEIFGSAQPSPVPSGHPLPLGEGASLGRETKGEVVLVSRLRAALERLNPALPPEAVTAAVDIIDPRPLSYEPGGCEPRGGSAAQGRHQGVRAGRHWPGKKRQQKEPPGGRALGMRDFPRTASNAGRRARMLTLPGFLP